MTREELKIAIELAKDYYKEVCKNNHEGASERIATEKWNDFMRRFYREGVYERDFTASVVYDGLRIGLTEAQMTKILEIAGILKKDK